MSALAWQTTTEPATPKLPSRPTLYVLPQPSQAPAATLRITRRGRLVITLIAFGVASLLALTMYARVTAPAPVPEHTTVIRSGQTLTEVARTQMPRLPVDVAVSRIRVANGLNSAAVVEGQALLIPAS